MSLANSGHLADSEGDNGDAELDDEDSLGGEDRFQPSSVPIGSNLSSFKRIPVPPMGGKVLDQRQVKGDGDKRSRSRGDRGEGDRQRKSKGEREKKVGQLDERNLKRAANRYGTLPKGARIGAYLESLRVSGMTPEPISDESGHDTLESTKSGNTDPGSKSVDTNPASMARSNSSHGGFPGSSSQIKGSRSHIQGSGPMSSQLPRRLQTYTQAVTPSSPRLKASALHELDFPPPPADSITPPANSSPFPNQRLLKSRDNSSDSCDSGRSFSDNNSLRLNCVSPVAESPVQRQEIHPTPQQQLLQEIVEPNTPPLPSNSPLPPLTSESTPAAQLVTELFESLKAKSVNEPLNSEGHNDMTENNDKQTNMTDFKAGLRKVPHPMSQENKLHEQACTQVDFKAQLKKTNHQTLYAQPLSPKEDSQTENFKLQLRKVNNNRPPSDDISISSVPCQEKTDFRSSLRSVSSDFKKQLVEEKDRKSDSEVNKLKEKDATVSDDKSDSYSKDDMLTSESKRKSTGSISSLVKIWETSDSPTSPVIPQSESCQPTSNSPTNIEERPGSVVKFEKRVWPPVPSTETEKPMVPVKPTVKPAPTSKPPPPNEPVCKPPPKPAPAAKPSMCNIYAAPNSANQKNTGNISVQNKPNISGNKPKLTSRQTTSQESLKSPNTVSSATAEEQNQTGRSDKRADSTDSGLSSSYDKESLVDISQSLDNILFGLSEEGVTKASAMSASDKVGSFHLSCSTYVDSIPATGRFRFRSLLAKLENQGKELRAVNVGKGNSGEINGQLVKELQTTVKDLIAVINR